MPREFSAEDFLQEEESAKKPQFKRDKQGFMRQVGLRYEFDCPECDANNPWDEGFGDNSEVRCHYCGQDYRVTVAENGKLKFKLA